MQKNEFLQASGLNASSCRIKFTWCESSSQAQFLAWSLKFDLTPLPLNLILWYQHNSFNCLSCCPIILQWMCTIPRPLCFTSGVHLTVSACPTFQHSQVWVIMKSTILVLQSFFKKVTENVIHFRKLLIENIELIFLTSRPWSYVLIILRVVLPGRAHYSHMPDKWGVILLIFSTTELITPLFIKRYVDSLKRNEYHKSYDSSRGWYLPAAAWFFSASSTW